MTEDQPLRLVRDDVPITGRLVDLEGRPVAGASIRVDSLWAAESPAAVDQLAEGPREPDPPTASDRGPIISRAARTPGDRAAASRPRGRRPTPTAGSASPAWAATGWQSWTSPAPRSPSGASRSSRGRWPTSRVATSMSPACKTRPTTAPARPSWPSRADRSKASSATPRRKAPIPGAIVTAMQLAGSIMNIEGLITARTDAEGRYRLVGLPKGDGHVLSVYPPLDRPYFITDFLKVSAGPGLEPVRFDIALNEGSGSPAASPTRRPASRCGRPSITTRSWPTRMPRTFPNFRANYRSPPTGPATDTAPTTKADSASSACRAVGIVAVKSFDRSYRLGVGGDRALRVPSRDRRTGRDGLPTYNQIHPQDFKAVAEVDAPADAVGMHQDFALEPSPSLTIAARRPRGQAADARDGVRAVHRPQRTATPTSTTRARPRSSASTPRSPGPCSSCTATASWEPS